MRHMSATATKSKKPNRDEQRRAREIAKDRSISYQSAMQEVQEGGSSPIGASTNQTLLKSLVSRDDYIGILRAVALVCGTTQLSSRDYDEFVEQQNSNKNYRPSKNRLPHSRMLLSHLRLATWQEAIEQAGLLSPTSSDAA